MIKVILKIFDINTKTLAVSLGIKYLNKDPFFYKNFLSIFDNRILILLNKK